MLWEVLALDKIRVIYEKTGRARYISHLDLYRCMQRTLRRAKLLVHYTEGFNPHQYLVFALPLSLGFESTCEVLDFALDETIPFEEVKARLDAALPEGLRVVSIDVPKRKQTDIAWSDYTVILQTDAPAQLKAAIEAMMASDEIITRKKNKKKQMVEVNLRPSIASCDCRETDGSVELKLRLPAGTQTNINPTLLCNAIAETEGNPDFSVYRVCRTKIICADGEEFF